MNSLLDYVQSLGGHVVAVSSQDNKWVKHAKMKWGIKYAVISDQRNVLAKKYNIVVTEKNDTIYKRIIRLARSFSVNTEQLEEPEGYKNGMTQAGLVVIKNSTNKVAYHWKSEPQEKNLYGATNRVSAKTVLNSINFYFRCEDEVDSIKTFAFQNLNALYNTVVNFPNVRPLFLEHLKKEYLLDLLLFVEEVDKIENRIKQQLNRPLCSYDALTVRNMTIDVYKTFILSGSEHEIILPEMMRDELSSVFVPYDDDDRGYFICSRLNTPIFASSYRHAKKILKEESLVRFAITEEFVQQGQSVITELSEKNKAVFCSDLANYHPFRRNSV
ncbi:rpoC [Acrasis kona]|uniref:RpoC n=1 Tax=Acrasis kona TaxID=1008807 RepID=A0AAW2YRH7_9EUKA